jgi:septum formation protein
MQDASTMTISLTHPFILASASPRREELLRSLGLSFKILPGHIDETYLDGESPRAHVRRLSRNKAAVIAIQHPNALVLGADTIVVIDGRILGKPKNKKQAREMLRQLSSREHTVFTGFTLTFVNAGISKTKVVKSSVQFKEISSEEIDWYVNCDEPYDKAGGYAVQGKGAYFIKSIRGSYTNVIGLPLCEVLDELKHIHAVHFR